ncbi:uncharacterized protein LOC134716413 isoform X1 [Mytilus trossulus]|uniref:uncharacterized protein LOC134716413 isoform X1 n=2 Tax=Mytilus trossulus TaxID=6551 RepID=UPI0030042B29
MEQQNKMKGGYSHVNSYELMCLENQGKDGYQSSERILMAFKVLDDIVPKLGVYARLMGRIKEDLHASVYSSELTTGPDGVVVNQPYFTLVQRTSTKEADKIDMLNEQLDTVKRRLFEKHKQFEESQQKIEEFEENMDNLEEKSLGLEKLVANQKAEIQKLEEELRDEKDRAADMEHRLQGDIHDLQDSIDEGNQEIETLSRYKKGYDDLYLAFLDTAENEFTKKRKQPVISTKRANLINNIESAQKLEEQLQTVLNTAVEEFDKFLEEHKDELQKIETGKEDVTEAELEIQEMDIEQADQELEAVQERFKNTVGDITNELQLLKHHSLTLQDQLQKLELSKPSHGRKELKILEPEGLTKGDSILSAGLGDEDEKNSEPDPFIPQEQVFSKYAAMVYTSSNNGKSFDTFKEADFCPSCGEKTVICPHKLPGSEKVFKLPHSCTHIKISRPKVRVNKDIIEEIMKPVSPEYTIDMAPSSADTSGYQRRPVTDSATSRGSPSIMSSEAHMPHSLHRLFDDYKDRTNVERNIPRPLPLDRTLSQIEQFWSYLMWTDENIDEKTIRNSVLDYLYMFMKERYIIEDIMFLCTHDFLSSVAEHSGNDKTVQVFGNILAGNLDGACFRYTMLLCDFIDQVEWKEVEDFRVFAGIAYRSMDDEDLETLQMTYTSFSENKISGQLVCQFIMHLILKCREPRVFDFENKLLPFKTHDAGQQVLTEKEFMDAIDQFVPLSNEKLRKKLYWESETAVRFDGLRDVVPISRLAQITAYLDLAESANMIKSTIGKKVEEERQRPKSAGSEKGVHESHVVPPGEPLISMTSVKNLAVNVSRRNMIRKERYENQDEGDWY